MRRALSFFLVTLLLLRGLLGDAMAMGMAAPVAQAAAPVHTAMEHGAHGNHGHHAEHAAPAHCTPEPDGGGHADHTGCTACGICHSAVTPLEAFAPPLAPLPAALRPFGGARFASALAAQAIKPPIS
ncbi:MAG: hypothetical protein QM740_00845 [Acidovorax sp.]